MNEFDLDPPGTAQGFWVEDNPENVYALCYLCSDPRRPGDFLWTRRGHSDRYQIYACGLCSRTLNKGETR